MLRESKVHGGDAHGEAHAAVGILMAVLSSLLFGSPATAQSVDGITTTADYRYTIDTDARAIDVDLSVALSNVKPNRRTNTGTTQYYFQGFILVIPHDAIDLAVTQDGRDVEFERIDDDIFDLIEVSFRRNLFYGNTADLGITYSLPDAGPRTDSIVTANPAYASFEVWAFSLFDTTNIEVVIPPEFGKTNTLYEDFRSGRTDDGSRTFSVTDLGSDDDFYSVVSTRNDDALVRREVTIDEVDVAIESWPGDGAWSNFVEETLESDLPSLSDTLGLQWPLDGQTLTVTESHAPYLRGYGGWYDMDKHQIEIGDELDERILLHELSHVLFNGTLFRPRWITEGLAEEFASIAAADNDEPDDPPAVSLVDSNAQPLSQWSIGRNDPAEEDWAYTASWSVTREIREEIGTENLAAVIRAALADELPYRGENEGEPLLPSNAKSWRHYLDYTEEIGETDELAELFADWVALPSESDLLEERAEAREIYADLEASGGGWAVPLTVRHLMSDWDFEDATAAMEQASAILEERDRGVAALAGFDVSIPVDAETAYQEAEESLDEAAAATTALADGAETLVGIHETADAERSLFTSIGLIGVDVDVEVTEATAQFEAGEFAALDASAIDLDGLLANAESDGKVRAGGAAAGLLVLLFGLGLLIRRFRRKRKSVGEEISSPGDASGDMTEMPEQLSPLDDGGNEGSGGQVLEPVG